MCGASGSIQRAIICARYAGTVLTPFFLQPQGDVAPSNRILQRISLRRSNPLSKILPTGCARLRQLARL